MTIQTSPSSQNDPVLRHVRSALSKLYGARLFRIVLFGSRARGDADPDSDYDIALFLDDMSDRWTEIDRLVPVQMDCLSTHQADVTILPFKDSDYSRQTGLMHAIRIEGVPL
jgi:uncharacterized protein